jgi:hypothetical protein
MHIIGLVSLIQILHRYIRSVSVNLDLMLFDGPP